MLRIAARLTFILAFGLTSFLLACTNDEQQLTATSTATATTTASPTATPVPSVTATATSTAVTTATPTPFPEPPVDAAIDALAGWLGPTADTSLVAVVSTEELTWSNGCLDISRVGIACTEALVPGFRIILGLGEATYEVRTDLTGRQTEWAPQVQILVRFAEASTNVALFTTDDGSDLETRLVPGTSFGLDLLATDPGTPVGIAIADAPQGGAPLLVWVDPFQGAVAASPTHTPAATTPPQPPQTATAAPSPATPPPSPQSVTVIIQGYGYQPQQLEIDAGTTVTWMNKDPVSHDSDSSDGLWDTPLIGEGETTSHTFAEAGKYLYFCSLHPYMQALVTVH